MLTLVYHNEAQIIPCEKKLLQFQNHPTAVIDLNSLGTR